MTPSLDQSLLVHFREATKASHETLDAAFGALDLSLRQDYVRFLGGHAIGMAPLFASFRSFVEGELGLHCPDYPAMLQADLAALDVDASTLATIEAASPLTPAGTGYVISGSRLGLAMIARKGYWGREHGLPSAYMDDQQGLAIWKQAAAHLKQDAPDEADAAHERDAAVAAFDTFRAAFAASASVVVP